MGNKNSKNKNGIKKIYKISEKVITKLEIAETKDVNDPPLNFGQPKFEVGACKLSLID